ncbi:uncharacterized protein [Dysidea avara]|uniref:uncharacterized protein isoform X2 n=1 Tax=Dysidea avara TaxID=196820 RepID=UPI003319C83E
MRREQMYEKTSTTTDYPGAPYYVILSLMLLHMGIATQNVPKVIGQVLELPPCDNCPHHCLWSHYGEAVPPHWIQSNGGLLLPANNWSVFGIITSQCDDGSNMMNYDITNPSEDCSDCLSLTYSPSVSQLCIRDIIHINTSTQQHHPHNGATSIRINGNIVSDIMKCSLVTGSDPRNPNVSYVCTALRSGVISLTAHTTYHGAEWSSPEVDITIVERCTVTETTNAETSTPTHPQSMATSLSQQRNTASIKPSSTIRSHVTTDTVPINPTNDNGDDVKGDDDKPFPLIAIIVMALVIVVVLVGIVIIVVTIFIQKKENIVACSKYKVEDSSPSTGSNDDDDVTNDDENDSVAYHIDIPLPENRAARQRVLSESSSLTKNSTNGGPQSATDNTASSEDTAVNITTDHLPDFTHL